MAYIGCVGSSSGGGGGSSYSETVLYNGITSGGTIPDDIPSTITFPDEYDNYDSIRFELMRGAWDSVFSTPEIASSYITHILQYNSNTPIVIFPFGTQWFAYRVGSDKKTLTLVGRDSVQNGIVRIIGIKY